MTFTLYQLIFCLLNTFIILNTKVKTKAYIIINSIGLILQFVLFINNTDLISAVIFQTTTFIVSILHYIKTK